MGRKAQRRVVVKSLADAIVSNDDIRANTAFYTLISSPGYVELLDEMQSLNADRKLTSFIVGDGPARLRPGATFLQEWATNAKNSPSNSEEGLLSSDTYTGVYYPWGLSTNLDGSEIMVPPSTMVLRAIARNDQVAYPWFAPAGYNRGVIDNATSVGYLTEEGEYKVTLLNEGQMATLQLNNINPIALIPNRGLVIFGQKTRHPVDSALDRVNVARLTNYLRDNLDRIAQPFLFEPNDSQTRDAIRVVFERFLGDIISLRGIDDFAVVVDETNNTPVRRDRNELWADIAVIPTKSVEFIYIPVRLLNSGASL